MRSGGSPPPAHPRCGECGFNAPGCDRAAPRRVECAKWGSKTGKVPWAEHRSRLTRDFEELVAYLAQVTDQTRVAGQLGISWEAVGDIARRVVARRLDPRRLEGLRRIGIDS